jgi:uncharacterized protein (TIGR03067 family)
MKTHALMILAAGLSLAADDPDKVKKDLEKMQGTWQLVSIESGGVQLNHSPSFVKVKGERLFWVSDPKRGREIGTGRRFKINPTTTPKAIDLDDVEVRATGQSIPIVVEGIYEVDGDTLKLCLNRTGERPKSFATKTEKGNVVLNVYKRE